MKKIEMLFYSTNPSEKNIGMKYVLFEVTMPGTSLTDDTNPVTKVIYDWGFADWLGSEWGPVSTPEDVTCVVKMWANTADPNLLLEEKRIVLLNK